MKNGICPKCGSATVHSKGDGLKYGATNGVVFVHTSTLTRPSSATAYICTTCGYFENYITDSNKLSDVAKHWPKVPPHSS